MVVDILLMETRTEMKKKQTQILIIFLFANNNYDNQIKFYGGGGQL